MTRRKVGIFLAFGILFFSLPLLSQIKPKRCSLGFTIGQGVWPSDAFNYIRVERSPAFKYFYSSMSVLEQQIKLKVSYGLNFEYEMNSYFAFRGELSHQGGEYRVNFSLFPLDPALPRAVYSKHILNWCADFLIVNAVFKARKSRATFVPYAFVGLGFCRVGGEKEESDYYRIRIHSSLDLALKAGGGFSCYWSQYIPIGLDLRAFILVLGARMFGFYNPQGGTDIIVSGYNIIWGLEGGLRYRF